MNPKNIFQGESTLLCVRAFEPYPFFVKEAKGSHIRDVDGNDYIDHCLAYGPILLGHSDDDVMADVKAQMEMGTAYGAPTENEIKLAKEVIDRVPCAEMVRFVSTGVEATMAAIRLARGYTQRDKIVKFEGAYHGAHDNVLVKPGDSYSCVPDSLGVPADTAKNTLTVPYNDEEALTKLIEEEGENIACVIVEPVMGNIGCIQPKIPRKTTYFSSSMRSSQVLEYQGAEHSSTLALLLTLQHLQRFLEEDSQSEHMLEKGRSWNISHHQDLFTRRAHTAETLFLFKRDFQH